MDPSILTLIDVAAWIGVIVLILWVRRLNLESNKQKRVQDLKERIHDLRGQVRRKPEIQSKVPGLREGLDLETQVASEKLEREQTASAPPAADQPSPPRTVIKVPRFPLSDSPRKFSGNSDAAGHDLPADRLREARTQRSGGVDIESDNTAVSGDVVGHDKITIINPTNLEEVERQRRIEAAFPAEPVIGQVESLMVQFKLPTSPISSDTTAQQDLDLPFHADAGTGAPIATTFKITVIAPGIKIYGPDTKPLRVAPDKDSPVVEFQLQCDTEQPGHIQVEVYAESGLVGQLALPFTPIAVPIPVPTPWLRQLNRGVVLLGQ